MSFLEWSDDLVALAGWMSTRSPSAPLILHGLELGALLASGAFGKGLGDALLLWSPPSNANDVLRAALLRRIAVDYAFRGERKPMTDYLRQLDTECALDIEGYRWSRRLWDVSLAFDTLPTVPNEDACWAGGRPVRTVSLDKKAAPLVKGSSLGYVTVNPDLSRLYAGEFDWIANVAGASLPRPK
jgi:hypothetical protein